jgi:ankyrin repeat protein
MIFFQVQTLTRILLNRGASPLVVDSERKTPLHHSVQRGFYGICLRLLESEVDPLAPDKDDLTPFDWALKDKDDAIAALILQYVPARTYVYVNVSQKGIALQ